MRSGIYRIVCTLTGKQYLGSTCNIARRWSEHRRQLRKGTHHSPLLQNAWNKYGSDAFQFEALWRVRAVRECLLYEEQLALNLLPSQYNIRKVAGSHLGAKRPPETGRRISAALKGHAVSQETRRRIGQANRGRKRTAEQRAVISRNSAAISDETRRKLSQAGTGRKHSEETRRRISEANKGRPPSELARQRSSETKRGKKLSDETRAKMVAAHARRRERSSEG